jgi:hypothetical protein
VWICVIVGVGSGGRDEAKSLWDIEQIILSVGLEWREVCTPVLKATTPSKGILHLETPYINYYTVYFIVYYCIYFSTL